MATFLQEPQAPDAPLETAPDHLPPDLGGTSAAPVSAACPTCGAPVDPAQDFCLECGEPLIDRGVGLPGWRTAASVLAITLVLASGAVAAGYAALKSDANSSASSSKNAALQAAAGPTGAGSAAIPTDAAGAAATPTTPSTATPPAVTPPATPAAKTPAKPTTAAPAATPAPVAAPVATPTPTPAPAAATPTHTTGTSTTTTPTKTTPAKAPLQPVSLPASAAKTYNPYGRPDTDFNAASRAIDGDPGTSWTTSFDDSGQGIVLDAGKLIAARRLEVLTKTPGITIEVYGTRSDSTPISIQDDGWDHVTTELDVASKTQIELPGAKQYRKFLVWITEGPADGSASVSLGELKLSD